MLQQEAVPLPLLLLAAAARAGCSPPMSMQLRVLLSSVLLLARGALATPPQPNILFIVVDDLAPTVQPYGGLSITPNMARLAEKGVQMQRAYVSIAVCAPSRCPLHSPHRLSHGLRLSPGCVSVQDCVSDWAAPRHHSGVDHR